MQSLHLVGNVELSNDLAATSTGFGMCIVRVPCCDGKATASTTDSPTKGLFHHLASAPSDLSELEIYVEEQKVAKQC